MSVPNQKTPLAKKPRYAPTAQELAAMRKFVDARAQKAPRVKVSKSGRLPSISPEHPDEGAGLALLMEAVGTADLDFLNSFLSQLSTAGSQGREPDERAINFMLSVVKGIEPRDQVEAMLAAQMAAVHTATMTFARRLGQVDNIPQQDSAERAFNKLARTFATQMEALKRYRTGGEQKVTVQHVTVSEGGQAIVGHVTQNRGQEPARKAASVPAALAAPQSAPMPIIDGGKARARVPVPRKLQQK